MMVFLLLMFIFISHTQSRTPKLCLDCKYRIPDVVHPNFSRCQKYPKKTEDTFFLVTGVKSFSETEYAFCATVRSDILSCGPFGLFYSKNLTIDKNVM
jgi:hypothetical protein